MLLLERARKAVSWPCSLCANNASLVSTLAILLKAGNHMALLNPGFLTPAVSSHIKELCCILNQLQWFRALVMATIPRSPYFPYFHSLLEPRSSRLPCVSTWARFPTTSHLRNRLICCQSSLLLLL